MREPTGGLYAAILGFHELTFGDVGPPIEGVRTELDVCQRMGAPDGRPRSCWGA